MYSCYVLSIPSGAGECQAQIEALAEAIAAHGDLFAVLVSGEGSILAASDSLVHLSGYNAEAVKSISLTALFECDVLKHVSETPTLAVGNLITKSGGRVPVRLGAGPVKGGGSVLVGRDVTEFKTLEGEASAAMEQVVALRDELDQQNRDLGDVIVALEGMALFDGLTGVANHRHFREQLRAMLDVCTRVHQPMSLVAVDVDHFKRYNDTYGHAAGDEVLTKIGSILKGAERVRDLAARPGGEEFALLLPITDIESATEIAESVRQIIEQTDWYGRPVTASFGVACSSERVQKADQLQAAADEALYEAKALGRNRVCRQKPASE